MSGVFITGTDTGVGKTIVTTALGLSLKANTYHVGAMKPIETGCDPHPSDTVFLQTMLELPDSIESICPIQLKAPLAPKVAAEQENTTISLKGITDQYRKLSEEKDIVLVEGAGGLMVPVFDDLLMAHLAVILKLPIILVMGNKLGAINHTLLSFHYAEAIGLRVLALIVNHLTKDIGDAERTNLSLIQDMLPTCHIHEMPFISDIHDKSKYTNLLDKVLPILLRGGLISGR